jgi:hypothetical protein
MNHSSPGSYVREIDRSQLVRGTSTSIGAIVGPAPKGPIMEPVLITNEEELISTFGRPNPKVSLMHYAALEFLSQSNRLYVTRVVQDNPSRGPVPLTAAALFTVDDITAQIPRPKLSVFDDGGSNAQGVYDPFNTFNFPAQNLPGSKNQLFMVCAANPGTWNNSLYIEVRPNIKPQTTDTDDFFDDLTAFWIDVWVDYKGPRQPKDESFLVKRVPALDGYGNQLYIEDVINTKSRLIRVRNNVTAPELKLTEKCHVFMDGGTNGGFVSMGQMLRGWDLYRDPQALNVNILIQGGVPPGMNDIQDIADIQRRMTDIAEQRMDAIAVLDIPSNKQATADAIAYRRNDLNIDSSYAAMYTPDVKIVDKFNDLELMVPPSGFIAAAYAYTDASTEVWFAPAGMSRGNLNVSEARHIYNQGHRDALTDSQINAIRFFPNGAGYKIWGADTLQTMASALSNVPVRRLMNMLEKAIGEADLYSVFDPNDQILRSRISSMITRYLQPIKDAGGLYWFRVVCDSTNNPPASIAAGSLTVDAEFDPVITTKRIKLTANILKTGTSFKELLVQRT